MTERINFLVEDGYKKQLLIQQMDIEFLQSQICLLYTSDPLDSFCRQAREAGVDLSIGELFAVGQEYSDNQCKSTNGGNPTPYDSFNDAYETFLASIS